MKTILTITDEQASALKAIKSFLYDDAKDVFILRGSAGTGKTTLIVKLVELLDDLNLSFALLAPTGRAARILDGKIKKITQRPHRGAQTIHSAIYEGNDLDVHENADSANDPGIRMTFHLKKSEEFTTLFIIDEASMVGDKETHNDFIQFGSGRLLADLVAYTRIARPGRINDHLTKLLFVGDPMQLPPVGENTSPALSETYLREQFHLQAATFDLHTVMRQAQGSAILDHAITLRDALEKKRFNHFSLQADGQEIEKMDASGAINQVFQNLQSGTSSVAVVYSNKQALEYNRSIREKLWSDASCPIQVKDILLVNKKSNLYGFSNGDLVTVTAAKADAECITVPLKGGHQIELRFRQVRVAIDNSNDQFSEIPCLLLENQLDSPSRELSALEIRALLVYFRKRHPDLDPKSDEFRKIIQKDDYFNALQVKYGYAITCHKAQGGEWSFVVVDFDSQKSAHNADFFRWTYTAITRAKEKLTVVNPPNFTAISSMDWRLNPATPEQKNGLNLDELMTDPDWKKFSFNPSIAALMKIHQKLRNVWQLQGIEIQQLQHLQYCERYTLTGHDQRVVIQYWYNKNFKLGRCATAPGATSSTLLEETALMSMRALTGLSTAGKEESFIQDFLDHLAHALSESEISITSHKSMPYRLRVSFSDTQRQCQIDFSYDGKQRWTKVNEVGTPGASYGLYEEIAQMTSSGIGK